MSTTMPPAPPTVQDLIALAQTLPAKSDKLATDTDASHVAVQNVATVTETQQAQVDAATAAMTIAVNGAQAAADAAVAVTEADRADLDAAIDQIVQIAQALRA